MCFSFFLRRPTLKNNVLFPEFFSKLTSSGITSKVRKWELARSDKVSQSYQFVFHRLKRFSGVLRKPLKNHRSEVMKQSLSELSESFRGEGGCLVPAQREEKCSRVLPLHLSSVVRCRREERRGEEDGHRERENLHSSSSICAL